MLRKRTTLKEIWFTLISPINYWRGNWRIIRYMWRSWRDEFHIYMHPLYLANLHLKRLPILLRIVKVEQVLLGNNRLSRLPNWLAKKQSIHTIDLAYNYFKEVPSVIFEMKNLKSFYIGSNDLKEIPKQLKTLSKLEYLSIPYCNLAEFPAFICDWITLGGLDISGNQQIAHLPEEIGQLENLMFFYLSSTAIENLPLSLRKIGLIRKAEQLRWFYNSISLSKNPPKMPIHEDYRFNRFCLPNSLEHSVPSGQIADCFKLLYAIVPVSERPQYLAEFWNERFKYFLETGIGSIVIEGEFIDARRIDWLILQHPLIEYLDIYDCINMLPAEIGELTQLKGLTIHGAFSSMPASFAQLTNLTSFSMEYKHFPFEVKLPKERTPQEEIEYVLKLHGEIIKC